MQIEHSENKKVAIQKPTHVTINAPDHSTVTVVDMISYGVNNGENAHHGSSSEKSWMPPFPINRSGVAVVVEAEVVVAVAEVKEHAVVVDPIDAYMETR